MGTLKSLDNDDDAADDYDDLISILDDVYEVDNDDSDDDDLDDSHNLGLNGDSIQLVDTDDDDDGWYLFIFTNVFYKWLCQKWWSARQNH